MKPFTLALFAAVLSVLFASVPAYAVPIEYTFQGTFDGTLNGVTETDQSFDLTLIGSSTSVTSSGGEFFNATISNQFTIGATTGSFTGFFNELVLNPAFGSGIGAVLFGQSNTLGFAGEATVAAPLASYNLATAFPLTNGTPNISTQTYFTTAGNLVINSMSALSFEAEFNDRVLPTPIPGALLLFASALGLMGLAAWRRKQTSMLAR